MMLEVERGLRFASQAPVVPPPRADDASWSWNGLDDASWSWNDDQFWVLDLTCDVLQAAALQGYPDVKLCLDSLQLWEKGNGIRHTRLRTGEVPEYANWWVLAEDERRQAIRAYLPVSRSQLVWALVDLWQRGTHHGIAPYELALRALDQAAVTRRELWEERHGRWSGDAPH